jgi:hypothetical protein
MRLRFRSKMPATPRSLRFTKWFVWVWAALFVAFGVGAALLGALEWDRAAASTGWPTVSGTVVESKVIHSTTRHKGRTRESHSARVTYRYEVGGAELQGSRISFRFGSSSKSAAEATVEKYPEGSQVQVHHDPDDPSLACLEPGTGDWQWVPLAIAACAVLLGGGVGWFLPRKIDARIRELESASGSTAAAGP